jgi:lipopolysaccharide export system ATP-binding protein
VPQHGGYFHEMTLYENFSAIAEIQIDDEVSRISKINYLISKFELDPLKEIKTKYLSGGQKRN